MQISEIEKIIYERIREIFTAPASKKSEEKIEALAAKIRKLGWGKETTIEYFEYAYKTLSKVKDRMKRSSVNYFIAIMTGDNNFLGFIDYLASASTDEKTEAEDTIEYKGRSYIPLGHSIGNIEVHYCRRKGDGKFMFLLTDYSKTPPRMGYLSKYNKVYPEKKIKRSKLIQIAMRQG